METSSRFDIWARSGAQERNMNWMFSSGSFQGINRGLKIAQKSKKRSQEQNLLKPETLALKLTPLLPIAQKLPMLIDFTFTKAFIHNKARAPTKLVPLQCHLTLRWTHVTFLLMMPVRLPSHFIDWETKAKAGQVTCPVSKKNSRKEAVHKSSAANLRALAFTTSLCCLLNRVYTFFVSRLSFPFLRLPTIKYYIPIEHFSVSNALFKDIASF